MPGRRLWSVSHDVRLSFTSFILSGQQITGEIGLGLAAAVLLDAFILRTFLVSALMHLSGRENWWLPAGWTASSRTCPSTATKPSAPPIPAPASEPVHAKAVG
jgi:RND superfamily putative drug exporter